MGARYFPDDIIRRAGCARSQPIPFGLKDGQRVSVAEVGSRLACGCLCYGCKSDFVAVKGHAPDSRKHRFRHHR